MCFYFCVQEIFISLQILNDAHEAKHIIININYVIKVWDVTETLGLDRNSESAWFPLVWFW